MKNEKFNIEIDSEMAIVIWNALQGCENALAIREKNTDVYMRIWNAIKVAIPSIKMEFPVKAGEEHLY